MLGGMDPWVTTDELSVWVQRPVAPGDEYAALVLKASTILVSWATGYDGTEHEFTALTAPDRLKIIVAQIAKRNYLNPTQITREGSIGPIGGDTYAAAFAAGMELTEEEEAEIAKIARKAIEGPGAGDDSNYLHVVGFNVAHNPVGRRSGTHIPDSSGSDWFIPMGG